MPLSIFSFSASNMSSSRQKLSLDRAFATRKHKTVKSGCPGPSSDEAQSILLPRAPSFFSCSMKAPWTARTAIFILFAPFCHQQRNFLLIDADHGFTQILGKLSQHLVIIEVGNCFYDG